jgi:hypothetical protein
MNEIEIVFQMKKTVEDEENDSKDNYFGTFSDPGKIVNCVENDWWKSLLARCPIVTKTEGRDSGSIVSKDGENILLLLSNCLSLLLWISLLLSNCLSLLLWDRKMGRIG